MLWTPKSAGLRASGLVCRAPIVRAGVQVAHLNLFEPLQAVGTSRPPANVLHINSGIDFSTCI